MRAYLARDNHGRGLVLGQLSVACVADDRNDVARVTVLPSRDHGLLRALFIRYSRHAGWGPHPLDVELTEGDVRDRIAAETATWTPRPPR